MKPWTAALPPLGLYVHVPWCVRKCPYCDFNSHALRAPLPEPEYLEALLGDLEQEAPLVTGRTVGSVFIGGGTPSLLSGGAIGRILDGIRHRVTCAADMEVTLEANPGTVEPLRLEHYLRAGLNRLSLGIQSFSAASLERLGRIHDPDQALEAYAMARASGFENINLDLMYGLPGQDLTAAGDDIRTALDLGPEHVSHYQLTLEPNTAFSTQPPPMPDDDLVADMHAQGQELLSNAGFEHYEVSAHCRPGRECRHNLNYWTFGDYLGIGAGAHGKRSDPAAGSIERRWKIYHPQRYLAASRKRKWTGGRRLLTREEVPFEFMMNALRLSKGVSRELYESRTGTLLADIQPTLTAGVIRGLLEQDGEAVRTTELGRGFLNDLLQLFLVDERPENVSATGVASRQKHRLRLEQKEDRS